MKTSAMLALAAAVAASAKPQAISQDVPVNCAKPNANYCMGGDIILRCNADALGTPGRCSDNVSGYPPAGGVASCHESSKLAGDAACQKNCVVYAEPSFTLAADQCKPSFTGSSAAPTTDLGTTGIISIPEGTVPTSMVSDMTSAIIDTIRPTDTMPTMGTNTMGTMSTPGTTYVNPIRNTTAPATGAPTTMAPTGEPTPTPSESAPVTVPGNGAASANHAGGLLAVVGAVAAYLI